MLFQHGKWGRGLDILLSTHQATEMKFLLPLLTVTAALLTGCATAPEPAKYVRIFDGATFEGWDGDMEKTWRIADRAFVGGSLETEVPRNEFIATTRQYTNFVLKLSFKLEGSEGFINGGVQVRSQRIPDHNEMKGYQVDMGDPSWWGCIYDESRRNKVMAQSNMDDVNKVLRRNDWNAYEIRCEGNRITARINGLLTVDYTELDESIPQYGRIGMQIHGGGKAVASYKNIYVKELP